MAGTFVFRVSRMALAAVTVAALATVGVRASADAASFARAVPRGPATPRAGIVPPRNPPKNIPPVPNFYAYCAVGALDDTAPCNSKVLQAIDRARGTEPVGPLRFSLVKFLKLSVVDQLFTIANLERVSRGEPPMAALTVQMDKVAQAGADSDNDPSWSDRPLSGGAQVLAWGSNWAGGSESALGADDGWMYDDGYGGHNGGCMSPAAAGCWGHRDNILRQWRGDLTGCSAADSQLVMGAAYARSAKWATSFAEIFVAACGQKPSGEVYTWTQAQAAIGLGSPRAVSAAVSAGNKGCSPSAPTTRPRARRGQRLTSKVTRAGLLWPFPRVLRLYWRMTMSFRFGLPPALFPDSRPLAQRKSSR